MTDLLLIRHAAAEIRRAGAPDESRALTAAGRRRFARAVRGLRRLGVRLDRVLHSPWLRAVETAELLAPIVDGELVVHAGLARAPERRLLADLGEGRVAVVGHEPWISELCALLLVGDAAVADRREVKKGGVIWLRGEPRRGGLILRAFLPPRALRRL